MVKDRATKIVESMDEGVAERHQINIALKTLKMSDVGASVMGGPDKPESIRILRKAGYNDVRIKKLLTDSGHTPEEITKLLKDAGQR
jgi:hypothetical protein